MTDLCLMNITTETSCFLNLCPRISVSHFHLYLKLRRPVSYQRQKVVCANRKFLQRILTVSQAGRDANLEETLQYELIPTPPFHVGMAGSDFCPKVHFDGVITQQHHL